VRADKLHTLAPNEVSDRHRERRTERAPGDTARQGGAPGEGG
jgi:hypothetical protein